MDSASFARDMTNTRSVAAALAAGLLALGGPCGSAAADTDARATERLSRAMAAAGACRTAAAGENARATSPDAARDAASQPPGTVPAGTAGRTALRDDLGSMSYPVATSSAAAQRWFDQGLRLVYAFNQPQALAAFREAQRLDPACAMCHWGESVALGANVNGAAPQASRADALAAARRALALADASPPAQRALIEAQLARHQAPDPARGARAYAEAMRAADARFPDDAQVPVLYAESLMLRSPWDYWSADGARARPGTAEAAAALERVLAARPDHPGAIHLYIHLLEASDRVGRAAPHARRLAALMPGASHLVHMPAHVWQRLGLWREAIEANREAAAIDEREATAPAAASLFQQGYYLHNLHFLLASALVADDADAALDAAARLEARVPRDAEGAQGPRAAAWLARARFGRPADTLSLPDPGARSPYVQAVRLHARGLAALALGRPEQAGAEADALARLRARADWSSAEDAGIPAREASAIALDVLRARIELARGRPGAAIGPLRAAVAAQDRLPYMEPAHWPEPLRPQLAEALAASGRAAQAGRVLREGLARVPNDPRALAALARTER